MNPDPSDPFGPDETSSSTSSDTASDALPRQTLNLGGILSWALIIALTLLMVGMTYWEQGQQQTDTVANKSDLMPIQMQARVLVGQRNMMEGLETPDQPSDDDENKEDADEADAGEGDSDAEVGESTGEEVTSDVLRETDTETDSETEDNADPDTDETSAVPIPEDLNAGTYEQRLCYVILVNEIKGPKSALKSIDELDAAAEEASFESTETQEQLRSIVSKLVQEQADGNVNPIETLPLEERDLLTKSLGWVGELAMYPEGASDVDRRTAMMGEASTGMWKLMGAFGVGLSIFVLGFAGFVVMVTLLATNRLRPKFQLGASGMNIYIQTFAIWMVVFFGMPYLIAKTGLITNAEESLMSTPFVFFGSLLVLIYPVMRGIPFSKVLADIGWKQRAPLGDLALSPVAYASWMPVILIGFFCVFAGMMVSETIHGPRPFGAGVAPGHPIQDFIAAGNTKVIILVFVTACIAAPIVEETMFRGVLYRHLRELTGHQQRWVSVVFSAVLNGVIFAAIHPQGLTAIPLLTSLAIGFSLAREWRDSLLMSIMMHAINNFMVTCLMVTIM